MANKPEKLRNSQGRSPGAGGGYFPLVLLGLAVGVVGLTLYVGLSDPDDSGYSTVKKNVPTLAEQVLADWENCVPQFVKVMPTDYKRVLEEMRQAAEAGSEG